MQNHQLHDGSTTDFKIVPFTDGSMPPQAPVSYPLHDPWITHILAIQHNLPPLVDAAAIRALTGPQATTYANGYGLGHIPGVPAR